ncbi:uncharacterized protein MONBRDRAFT_28146 [Monosiga brevicollis MX1]|uniref:Thymus-specific serine protease n=1 Tax=Monosiga brevicollis TaxID=81824 RepID=A9V7C1_MONBE|nr:uncharacterized protein MONBRDRAFT_28146 [Monosiga brevicollis MX1]EDQ86489.1 predicted protein [Monosiga brevicollis MX1]|eukprot:XP_001748602.1 hypothetical protein [Monosiga brevicollis MX1]
MPSSSLPAPRFVTQRLDHFDGSDTTTWQQAYYVNSTYFQAGSDAPVYLCVGGEGPPLDGSVVVASVHCNVAVELLPKTGAIMFALEHRYYGCHNMSACPVENPLAKGALRYLSSRQALGDLAAFISYIRQQYNLPNNKIVTFGGSYPGMLAGWARLKYPHLVHASVASSAPVEAVLDMRGYYDVTAFAYSVSDNNVGGSDACRAAIATGHATIGQYFNSSSGRNTLANIFGLPASYFEKYDNQASFAGGGVAYFPSQSNDPSCTQAGCNINLICQVMTNTSLGDEVHRLAVVRKQQLEWLPAAFESFATKTLRVGAEADYWGYQTCTEFAFYQTCEVGSDCFFTQGYLTLNATEAACQAEFGIDFTTVQQNVIASNAWYGGRNSAGSCLMYPNGEVDPWNSQSILNTTAPGITTLMVPGASHHAWTHPSAPSDQPSVVAARKTIADFVSNALNQACGQV